MISNLQIMISRVDIVDLSALGIIILKALLMIY